MPDIQRPSRRGRSSGPAGRFLAGPVRSRDREFGARFSFSGKNLIYHLLSDNIDVNTADVERIASDMDDLSIKLRDISNNFGTSLFTLPDFGFKRILYSIFTFAGILSFAFVLIGTGMILINRKINLYLTK